MSEVPLFPLWVTVFLTIWAVVGPLLGVAVGHYLVRSWERKRWLADNRKDEYRRVLAGLTKLNMLIIDRHSFGTIDMAALKEAMEESSMAFNTCLFINDFLERTKVAGDIVKAVKKFHNGGSFDDYHKEYWKSVNLILADANKSAL